MNTQLSRLNRTVSDIRSKFEAVKKLDGTHQDASPAGDGYVEISDEYESRGHVRFDPSGRPLSMQYSEWDPYSSDLEEGGGEITSYYISQHEESGHLYYFSESESANGDSWSPGPRIAVDSGTGEVAGTFDISHRPHKFVPLA
jgi:hypothetical protein